MGYKWLRRILPSLSRDRVRAHKTVVNFPPPDDVSDLLEFFDCEMRGSLLVSVKVRLKNIDAARARMRVLEFKVFLKGDGVVV